MEPTGLREQNKQRTMHSIVVAAAEMFADQGYEQTKIEDIAGSAAVSPATVYNYFGTKGAILAAVAGRDLDVMLAEAAGAFDLSAASGIEAFMPAVDVYIKYTVGLGRGLLKEILRAGLDPAASDVLEELVSMDEAIIRQIGTAIEDMQTSGLISPTVDAMAASLLVYSVLAGAMIWFVSVPDMHPGDMRHHVRGQIEIVFEGLGT